MSADARESAALRKLHVLFVEDSEDDMLLCLRHLRAGPWIVTHERVDTGPDLERALASTQWDLVISDYTMPTFSGRAALETVKASGLDLPFIIVSGTIGEEIAVDALKAGAHDFLVKGRPGRLIPAIERELREADNRRRSREAEEGRRAAEAQLLVADRMAAVGLLAAGLAHEINNPMAAVVANLELARAEIATLSSAAVPESTVTALTEELRDASEAADRVRAIVRDLKIFSRGQDERIDPVDVETVMESTLRLAWNEVRHRARLVRDYAKIPPVQASVARLGQVFLNLVVNAVQAIPEGQVEQNEIRVATRMDREGRVIVEVADTGPGIPPEIMQRLFTPFLTTKPVGVGTGLGLSICHRIVTGFGGEISASSTVGKGTTFRVALRPASPPPQVKLAPPAVEPAGGRRGRILIVDDEPMIGRTIERALEEEHDVTVFQDGADALKRIEAGERFDVILCDLMMPEMSGMALHDAIAGIDPAQAAKMVFLTGGAFTDAAREFLDRVPNTRLEKPFDVASVRSLIRTRVR